MTHRVDTNIYRYGKNLKWDFSVPQTSVLKGLRLRYLNFVLFTWYFRCKGINVIKIYYALESRAPSMRVVGFRREYQATLRAQIPFMPALLSWEKRDNSVREAAGLKPFYSIDGIRNSSPLRSTASYILEEYGGKIALTNLTPGSAYKARSYPSLRDHRPMIRGGGFFERGWRELYAYEFFSRAASEAEKINLTTLSCIAPVFKVFLDPRTKKNYALDAGESSLLKSHSAAGYQFSFAGGELFTSYYVFAFFKKILSDIIYFYEKKKSRDAFCRFDRKKFLLAASSAMFGLSISNKLIKGFPDSAGGPSSSFISEFARVIEGNIKCEKNFFLFNNITIPDLVILLARKRAFLAALRSVEENYFFSAPSFSVSNYNFFTKLCTFPRVYIGKIFFLNEKKVRALKTFTIADCRRIFFKKMQLASRAIRWLYPRNTIPHSHSALTRLFLTLHLLGVFEYVSQHSIGLKRFVKRFTDFAKSGFAHGDNTILSKFRDTELFSKNGKCGKEEKSDYSVLEEFNGRAVLPVEYSGENRSFISNALKPISRGEYSRLFDEIAESMRLSSAVSSARGIIKAKRVERREALVRFREGSDYSPSAVKKMVEEFESILEGVQSGIGKENSSRFFSIQPDVRGAITAICKYLNKLLRLDLHGRKVRFDGFYFGVLLSCFRAVINIDSSILSSDLAHDLLREKLKDRRAKFSSKSTVALMRSSWIRTQNFPQFSLNAAFKFWGLKKFCLFSRKARYGAAASFPLIFAELSSSGANFLSCLRRRFLGKNSGAAVKLARNSILNVLPRLKYNFIECTTSLMFRSSCGGLVDNASRLTEDMRSAFAELNRGARGLTTRKSMQLRLEWLRGRMEERKLDKDFKSVFGSAWNFEYYGLPVLFIGNYGLMRLASRASAVILRLSRKGEMVTLLQTFIIAFYSSLYLKTVKFLLDFLAGYMDHTMTHRMLMKNVGNIITNTNLANFGVTGLRIGLYGKFNGEDRGNRVHLLWGQNPCLRYENLKCTYANRQAYSKYGITHLHLWIAYI